MLNNLLLSQISTPDDVDMLYTTMVNIVKNATDKCIPRSKFKPFIKPYRNIELSNLHNNMNDKRLQC